METLASIAERHDTTKGRRRAGGKLPALAEVYERYLGSCRERTESVLEIGVERGGSLEMWSEFFPRAHVWGVDIKERALQFSDRNITVRIGDQGDETFLASLVEETGPLDLILDDGSHQFHDQRSTLLDLWPHLQPGGIYIVEDIHTSYRPAKYGGALRKPGTFVEFLKDVIDDVHVKEHKQPGVLTGVESVHVHFQSAILFKAGPVELFG